MPVRSAIFVLVALMLPVLAGPQATPIATGDAETISCRSLEMHTDDDLKVTIIIFHQRNQEQRSQLAALLQQHSGAMVEVQTADGKWRRARLLRLKSCFGRGLLIMPAAAPFSERAVFSLRLAQ